jgi:hypothetical protein
MLQHTIGTVKRNHALEHATISMLASKLGRTLRVVGRSTNSGFYIYGNVDAENLEQATQEALARLRRGEGYLAISPMCGTNLAVAGILAGLASLLALGSRSRIERVPNVVLASMLAVMAAQPLGRLAQKHLTTDPDLSDTEVVGIRQGGMGPGRYYKVDTVRAR